MEVRNAVELNLKKADRIICLFLFDD
jgi:hypothetical protein